MAHGATQANLPVLSIGKTVNLLTDTYCGALREGLPFRELPSVMLWGPPGVGKSQAVRQIGSEIAGRTGRKVQITDVRLLLFNPIDLRGIPTANADKTLAVWLKPQIFQMDDSPEVVNMLFLDEISAAPQSVQAAAYQITLDRQVGEHRLPENCIVLAAGNRVTDKSVAFKMPKALANRLLHIEIESGFESWKNWATQTGVNKMVLGYLSFAQNKLFGFDPDSDDLAFATPRSWEMVSHLLNHINEDPNAIAPLIAGLVGSATAFEFRSWCRIYSTLPDIKKIFAGEEQQVPQKTDELYAVASSMLAYAREHSEDAEAISNSLTYAAKLPADFARMITQGYMIMRPGYKQVLEKMPEYQKLVRRKGEFSNGRTR